MKDVSEAIAEGDKSRAKTITYASLLTVLSVSLILSSLLLIFAPSLSSLLGDRRVLSSLHILSFAVLITGFENIYKSSFYADGIVKIPAFTEIAEQIFRIMTVVLLILFYAKDDIELSSAVLTFGIFAGEALSLVILFASYYKTFKGIPRCSFKGKFSSIINTALPVTASRTAETFLGSASNILIPAMLTMYGLSRGEATEILGVISGMVMPLLFLPSVFTNALSVNLVPFISANLAKGNLNAVGRKIEKVLFCTALFAFPSFLCLAALSKPLAEYVFSDSRVALFLPLMSLGALFATFRHILTSILNASAMAKKASFYSFTGNALQLILTTILIPFIGITGYLFSYIISNILLFIPTAYSVFTLIPPDKGLLRKVTLPLFPAVFSFGISYLLYDTMKKTLFPIFSMAFSALTGAFLYLFILFILFKNKKIIFFSKKT